MMNNLQLQLLLFVPPPTPTPTTPTPTPTPTSESESFVEDPVVPEPESETEQPVEDVEEPSNEEAAADEEEKEYVCSFDAAGALLNQWGSGFVINKALFSTCAGTTIEFDWVEGSGECYAEIVNYWNTEVEVYNNGKTVKFTTMYDYSPFGFQAEGQFAIENLRVNGESCPSY